MLVFQLDFADFVSVNLVLAMPDAKTIRPRQNATALNPLIRYLIVELYGEQPLYGRSRFLIANYSTVDNWVLIHQARNSK